MRSSRVTIATLALVALSSCATTASPVQVTRFHALAGPSTSQTFLMDRPTHQTGPDGLWVTHATAVASQLSALGYRCAAAFGSACVNSGSDEAALRVVMLVETAPVAGNRNGSGVGVGIGGSTGSYGSGVGLGVGLDITRLLSGPGADTAVRLSARMVPASGGNPVWEGRAETRVTRRMVADQPEVVADRLARALFSDFPGRSGETITVP